VIDKTQKGKSIRDLVGSSIIRFDCCVPKLGCLNTNQHALMRELLAFVLPPAFPSISMEDAVLGGSSGSSIPTPPELQPDRQRQRGTRKDCLLSHGERLAIEPFKERYKAEHRKDKRVAMAKSEILTAYFNYLHSQNEDPPTEEKRMKKTKVSNLIFKK
jgi:hypothetical protein